MFKVGTIGEGIKVVVKWRHFDTEHSLSNIQSQVSLSQLFSKIGNLALGFQVQQVDRLVFSHSLITVVFERFQGIAAEDRAILNRSDDVLLHQTHIQN